jgi:hypothetical protein
MHGEFVKATGTKRIHAGIFPNIGTVSLGAELVQRHGAEHRDPLAEHPERHPHGALAAALASDPRIPGLEIGLAQLVICLVEKMVVSQFEI